MGRSRFNNAICMIAIGLINACSSVPEENGPTQAALLAEPPREIIDGIELAFRKKVAFVDTRDVEVYLQKIANRLFAPGKSEVQVTLVSTASTAYPPSVWVIPARKIFFDLRVLRSFRFENEIAAAIAYAWEQSAGIEFRRRLIDEGAHGDPDPLKIWSFNAAENEHAIESAVDRIYKAGYDPRGLVSYFDRIPVKPGNALESEAEGYKEKTRRVIYFYAPLLNPIVRTEDFYKMRKKLERL